MAKLETSFYSNQLRRHVYITVLLPDSYLTDEDCSKKPLPVLYMLHGYGDDRLSFLRSTGIEHYVNEHQIAIILPDAANSFYTDMGGVNPYYSYLVKELPTVTEKLFSFLTRNPKQRYIAGVSMGGYGAFRCALLNPEQYGLAISISGGLDMVSSLKNKMRFTKAYWESVFGDLDQLEGNNQFDLISIVNNLDEQTVRANSMPDFQIYISAKDFLYKDNQNMLKSMQNKGLHIYCEVHEEGDHSWTYWDRVIKLALEKIETMDSSI